MLPGYRSEGFLNKDLFVVEYEWNRPISDKSDQEVPLQALPYGLPPGSPLFTKNGIGVEWSKNRMQQYDDVWDISKCQGLGGNRTDTRGLGYPETFEICRQNRSEATSRKTERLGLLKHAWSRSIRTRPVRTMTGTVHHAVSLLGYPPTRSKHLPISGSSDIPVVETTENEDSDTSSVSDPVMALFEQNLAPDWELQDFIGPVRIPFLLVKLRSCEAWLDSEIEKAREVEARIDFNQKYGVSTISSSSSSSLSYHRAGWLAGRQDIHSLENVFPDQGMVELSIPLPLVSHRTLSLSLESNCPCPLAFESHLDTAVECCIGRECIASFLSLYRKGRSEAKRPSLSLYLSLKPPMLPVLLQQMKPPPALYPPLLRLVQSLPLTTSYQTLSYALASFAFYAYAALTFAPSFSSASAFAFAGGSPLHLELGAASIAYTSAGASMSFGTQTSRDTLRSASSTRGPKRISESKGRIAPKQKRSSSKGRFKKQSRNKEEVHKCLTLPPATEENTYARPPTSSGASCSRTTDFTTGESENGPSTGERSTIALALALPTFAPATFAFGSTRNCKQDNKGGFRQLAGFEMGFPAGVPTCFPIPGLVPTACDSYFYSIKIIEKHMKGELLLLAIILVVEVPVVPQVQIVIATTCPTLTERSNGSFFLTSDGSVRLGSLRKEVRASSRVAGTATDSESRTTVFWGELLVEVLKGLVMVVLGTSKEDFEPQQQKKTLAQDSVERWKGKVPTEVSLSFSCLSSWSWRRSGLGYSFTDSCMGKKAMAGSMTSCLQEVSPKIPFAFATKSGECQIVRRRKTGLSLISEPVAMVDNLRAEGGDNAETERTLAERLHKLTTLENKEVMSDSKIDRESCLIQSRTLKLHFPTFEEIGPVVFLEQKNSLHTIKVKRRIDVDFLP
ncbi:hypothetical protein Acr_00g0002390 [Actinidia rufa]|uniref:Uncharacterized protein n=1 Tax=Actinidia rufa TaxID=165716 RepID=A0A7J0D6V0_9ERIC|nr:hypothetical protein Acr_00g0002390 [Actinidia rufa]